MRKLRPQDLVGKTIVDAECDSVNCMTLSFDDETELQIWCECAVTTSAGSIFGFYVDGDEDDDNE